MKFRVLTTVALAVASFTLVPATQAQLGDLGRALGQAAGGLGSLTRGTPPVSTSIRDARWADPSRDGFTPPGRAMPLERLPRTPEGGFTLAAGYYVFDGQSYCLHAGTHGPGGGDGYLYAPVLGSRQEVVTTILRNSVANPDIPQHQVQQLLWAIVARARLDQLRPDIRAAAGRLMSPQQFTAMNRNALATLTANQLQGLVRLPGPVQSVLRAESDLRGMLTTGAGSYADMERVAVLSGAVERGEGSIDTPSGRWSAHPDGYWIRYIPSGYSRTRTEIWVEPGSAAVGRVYDPAQHIAVPGNTNRQRLAQSGRIYSQ
ncbi:hypothetical protein GV829_03570 [Sphingomonas lacunae]|uniref:Uncharacterized protein n=1 Tax=Sphingomonas lacunae TaxID=2698828 RepID=A0A6M4ARG4_9SPHN|nr:hypothetical protein [Sphingomonas lacunae]QJQ31635.1 hypothetical protein GV829_03570 [Sphingomonas lacunae]